MILDTNNNVNAILFSARIFNKDAFTLIELLVVVLIIGILAAIALPQYQKAVKRSRGAEALTNARAVAEAANRFFLQNGTYSGINFYAKDKDDSHDDLNIESALDIDLPPYSSSSGDFAISLQGFGNKATVFADYAKSTNDGNYYIDTLLRIELKDGESTERHCDEEEKTCREWFTITSCPEKYKCYL